MVSKTQENLDMNPIFISAGGRSGSTWLLDSLAKANGMRTIFEPLHPERIPGAEYFANRYIRDEDDVPELKQFLDEVIWGGRGKLWAKYRINKHHFWHGHSVFSSLERAHTQLAKYRKMGQRYFRYRGQSSMQPPLVKFIRANLMLGWLHKKYASPILVFLRHPGAVVESKMRLWQGGWRYDELDAYIQDKNLVADYLPGMTVEEFKDLSAAESFAAVWCIETRVALDQARRHGFAVACYENLLARPAGEWQRVAQQLGLKNIPKEEWLKKPSQQSSPHHKSSTFDQDSLGKWRARMNDNDLKNVESMLQRFQLSVYSMHSSVPNSSEI